MKKLEDFIVNINDFPKPGIIFRDVTGVLADPEGFRMAIDAMSKVLEGVEFDMVAGLEARGFFFASPLAYHFGKGLVPVRKKGKLPRETVSTSYLLEYAEAAIEIHKDAIQPGQKVVIIDDLLATGGSAKAAASLIEELGGEVVKIVTLIELTDLKGREALSKYDVESIIAFEGE